MPSPIASDYSSGMLGVLGRLCLASCAGGPPAEEDDEVIVSVEDSGSSRPEVPCPTGETPMLLLLRRMLSGGGSECDSGSSGCGGDAEPSNDAGSRLVPFSSDGDVEEIADLARVLLEAAAPAELPLHCSIGQSGLDWTRLVAALESETLGGCEDVGACLVEVNSGGKVFFALLSSRQSGHNEEVVAVKFGPDRLATQSEFLGYELACQLGVGTPPCALLRRGQAEWTAMAAAAAALGGDGEPLAGWLGSARAALVVGFVPGSALSGCAAAWAPGGPAEATAEALGGVLLLDLVLGNSDRLALPALSWRGNDANLRYGPPMPPSAVAAIDHTLPRRPPPGVGCTPDACRELAAALASDPQRAQDVLSGAVNRWDGAPGALAGEGGALLGAAFARGFNGALQACGPLEEGLELLREGLEDAVGGFFVEVGLAGSKAEALPNTVKLRKAQRQAKLDDAFWESFSAAEGSLRTRLAELRAAVAEWLAASRAAAPLSTGFLDSSVGPLVQAYELKVRVEHVLARLMAMTALPAPAPAPPSTAPVPVAPGLCIGGVLVAGSLPDLRAAGVTHVLNAAGAQVEDYFPDDFTYLRIDLDDTPEAATAMAGCFEASSNFIDAALSSGGTVLVHCFEGRSRSATLLLAFLMARRGATLKDALAAVRAAHPPARPNPGFFAQLRELDVALHGRASLRPVTRPAQPQAKVCPVCAKQVGISMSSLTAHLKRHHPEAWRERQAAKK
eukprot:jgi/Tetstr1/455404/TSEL_042236.t1